jgi:hypothetical protein
MRNPQISSSNIVSYLKHGIRIFKTRRTSPFQLIISKWYKMLYWTISISLLGKQIKKAVRTADCRTRVLSSSQDQNLAHFTSCLFRTDSNMSSPCSGSRERIRRCHIESYDLPRTASRTAGFAISPTYPHRSRPCAVRASRASTAAADME